MTGGAKPESANRRMLREVGSKQRRMEAGGKQWAWNSITVLGVVGWSVTIPTLVGAAIGIWIDHHWPSRFSWSLMLLLGGLLFGCVQAWQRIKGDRP